MAKEIKNRELTVLLVSDSDTDLQEVEKQLKKTMGVPSHVLHSPSVVSSAGLFHEEMPGIDIVLLDLDLIASASQREIFHQMQKIVGPVPIIVFTERAEHELALLVVEEGAADNVTKGQFSTDPYKLRDAIQFALARSRISKKTELSNAANIQRIGDIGAAKIKSLTERQETVLAEAMAEASIVLRKTIEQGNSDLSAAGNWADIVLEEVLEHGENDLRKVKTEAAAAIKEVRDASTEREREHAQTIHWLSGGYSMEKGPEIKS
jgi:DNA-binding NarL/FixJ family response regulator